MWHEFSSRTDVLFRSDVYFVYSEFFHIFGYGFNIDVSVQFYPMEYNISTFGIDHTTIALYIANE